MALTSEVEIIKSQLVSDSQIHTNSGMAMLYAVFKNLTQKHNDVVVEDNDHQQSS